MRALMIALLLATTGPAISADYGTPGACAVVASGYDPRGIAGGLVGEESSYFFDGGLLVGPEFECEIVEPGPSECFLGGDEPTIFDIRTEVMADRAIISIEGTDPIYLKPCPVK